MSFIAAAPPPATQPGATPGVIGNDGWFPDIVLSTMRDAMRLDGTVTDPRLAQAVVDAILHVNDELADWKAQQVAAGHAALADVPATTVNQESRHLVQYRRAVYSMAKADLVERYRDYDTTGEGHKKAEWQDNSPEEQRRNAHWAIADIQGRTRSTIELI